MIKCVKCGGKAEEVAPTTVWEHLIPDGIDLHEYECSRCGHLWTVETEHEAKTTVVHCKREAYDVYIGRGKGCIWGNPFSHLPNTLAQFQVATREEAIAKYREWIQTQPQILAQIHTLKGKRLGCWCKPQSCHGDVLAELADAL